MLRHDLITVVIPYNIPTLIWIVFSVETGNVNIKGKRPIKFEYNKISPPILI